MEQKQYFHIYLTVQTSLTIKNIYSCLYSVAEGPSREEDHVWGSVASKALNPLDYITRILFPALFRQLLRKTPLCEYRAFEQCDTLRRRCATDRDRISRDRDQ